MTRDFDARDFEFDDDDKDAPAGDHETHDDADGNAGDHDAEGGDRRGGRDRRPRIDSFEKMKVWQEAHELTRAVFEQSKAFPAEHIEITRLMRIAAVGVPASIAEGFKRRGPRNKAHFYNIAQTSLESLRYYLILCRDLGFRFDVEDLTYRGDTCARMLDGLVRSMTR